MNALVDAELAQMPRGAAGSAQNLFRLAYRTYRMNGLGRRPTIEGTAAAAYHAALDFVRRSHPEFAPMVLRCDAAGGPRG